MRMVLSGRSGSPVPGDAPELIDEGTHKRSEWRFAFHKSGAGNIGKAWANYNRDAHRLSAGGSGCGRIEHWRYRHALG
jgi:hypothetical protein